MNCEVCGERASNGYYVCLRVRGTQRWYRVCEDCHNVYLHLEGSEE